MARMNHLADHMLHMHWLNDCTSSPLDKWMRGRLAFPGFNFVFYNLDLQSFQRLSFLSVNPLVIVWYDDT